PAEQLTRTRRERDRVSRRDPQLQQGPVQIAIGHRPLGHAGEVLDEPRPPPLRRHLRALSVTALRSERRTTSASTAPTACSAAGTSSATAYPSASAGPAAITNPINATPNAPDSSLDAVSRLDAVAESSGPTRSSARPVIGAVNADPTPASARPASRGA